MRILNGFSSSLSSSISFHCFLNRSSESPFAIPTENEWSVTAMYSYPLSFAARAIFSSSSAPSLQVVCIWRSPLRSPASTRRGSLPSLDASISPVPSLSSGGMNLSPSFW